MAEFAAIGFASNVIQFAEYGIKLTRKYRELSKSASGATAETEQLEEDVLRFRNLLQPVKGADITAFRGTSKAEKMEEKHRRQCDTLAAELLVLLNRQRPRKKGRIAILKYLANQIWSTEDQGEIDAIRGRLEELRIDLVLYAVENIRYGFKLSVVSCKTNSDQGQEFIDRCISEKSRGYESDTGGQHDADVERHPATSGDSGLTSDRH